MSKKLVETTQPAMVATSYATVVKATTRSAPVNIDLKGRFDETQYKNIDVEKLEKQVRNDLRRRGWIIKKSKFPLLLLQIQLHCPKSSSFQRRSSTVVPLPNLHKTRKHKRIAFPDAPKRIRSKLIIYWQYKAIKERNKAI